MLLTSLMTHALAVQAAAGAPGVEARIDLATFGLEVRTEGSPPATWHPRFMAKMGARLAYTDAPGPATIGFAGWLPYRLRRWAEASDKGAFKAYAERHGVATPAACLQPGGIGGPFLIKPRNGSFGLGQRGPFRLHDPQDPRQQLGEGEYYENFIVGLIAKAWCWGGECVALELQRPSIVVGDGIRTLRDLAQAGAAHDQPPDWDVVAGLAACLGIDSLDTVLAAGRQALVEYRYGNRQADPGRSARNRLDDARACGLSAQFESAARKLQGCVPADMAPALYTLDAVVDPEGQALFLEMNCNPVVHPAAYAAMLASVLPAADASPAAQAAQPWEEVECL